MRKTYSDNDNLQITVDPGTVYISTNPDQSSYANIVITVENTSNESQPVNTIAITLPATLAPTNALGSITPFTSVPDLWSFGPSSVNAGEFDADSQSGNNVTINPADTWQFTLQMVTLNNTVVPSSADVTVAVTFGDGLSTSTPLNVNIESAVASITSFYSQPANINPGDSAQLNWQCEQIIYCIISPIDVTHRRESGSTTVKPLSTTIYTLYAYGASVILSAQWAVSVNNPQIIQFGAADGQTSVDLDSNITLTWACNEFAESLVLTNDGGVTIPSNLYTSGNTVQSGSITVGPLTMPTTFVLTAYGNDEQHYDQWNPTININNVTANLTASPDSGLWEKDKVTITWSIENALAVNLSPTVTNGPSLQNLSGSVEVNPAGDITYTLNVTGCINNQKTTISPSVTLAVTPVLLNTFNISPSSIDPDNVVNSAEFSWDAQAQVLSLNYTSYNFEFYTDNSIDTSGLTSYQLYMLQDGTTYTLWAGTVQNPQLLSKKVSVNSLSRPYFFDQFSYDADNNWTLFAPLNPDKLSDLNPSTSPGGYWAIIFGAVDDKNPEPAPQVSRVLLNTSSVFNSLVVPNSSFVFTSSPFNRGTITIWGNVTLGFPPPAALKNVQIDHR